MTELSVVILWHMHQPDYRDPVSGLSLLPWTYLHAVKDYAEMLKTAEEFPSSRLTFNIVPTLIEQLEDYAAGRTEDVWLRAARTDPAAMSPQDCKFVLDNFFTVYPERHIKPFRRYRDLAERRRQGTSVAEFSDGDLRDLQVWFLLAWSGHHLRRQSNVVPTLLKKGAGFSERDKSELLALYDAEVADVVNRYRRLEQSGQIEISVTPYAHPILPLLCDLQVARQAAPTAVLPEQPFRHTADARLQVRTGLRFVEERLGERARGMWPAEGAISEEALRILREEGATWAASDEGVLSRSLPGLLTDRRQLYRSYSFEGLPLLFRDRQLSDRIGFVYASWDPQQAADDLVGHLKQIAGETPDGIVPLILDGENCWERYADNGYPFLGRLYQMLEQEPGLRMTTVSEALAKDTPSELPRLSPGSWIHADFDVWIGHPEENTAWDRLGRARESVTPDAEADPVTTALADGTITTQLLHLLRAEGSDWFWWYGEHHSSEQAETFDLLFRRHLEALYQGFGKTAPDWLQKPIKVPERLLGPEEPSGPIRPIIDGRISDYFEWLAAGRARLSRGGAMHSGQKGFTELLYGYDAQNLYLRLDAKEGVRFLLGAGDTLEIRLTNATPWTLLLHPNKSGVEVLAPDAQCLPTAGEAACDTIVELAVPLEAVGFGAQTAFTLSIHRMHKGRETGRWPAEVPLNLIYRGASVGQDQWYV